MPESVSEDPKRRLVEACRAGNEETVRALLAAGADPNGVDRMPRHVSVSAETGVTATGWTPLMWAAHGGSVSIVRLLLRSGARVNASDTYGLTPLMAAAIGGHSEILSLLLEEGADLPHSVRGESALAWACFAGRADAVRFLLSQGADPHGSTAAGDRPGFSNFFYSAIYQGFPQIVQLLLDAGVDPNARNSAGWTPLLRASESAHAEIVEQLLAAGAVSGLSDAAARGDVERMIPLLERGDSPNEADTQGGFPLQRAVRAGSLDAVRLLLDHGADPALGETTPLSLAVTHDRPEIIALLLERGARLEPEMATELLVGAAGDGSAEIVRVLLLHGVDACAVTPAGIPAIACAAYSGDAETVRLLLEAGADPNAETEDGITAVRSASEAESEEVVRLLWERGAAIGVAEAVMIGENGFLEEVLRGGADPDAQAGDASALVLAIKRGDVAAVRLLVEAGADRSRSPWPPVWAILADQREILEFLLDAGWPLNQSDTTSRTPLHRAVERVRPEMVRLLLVRGADRSLRDRSGQTALDLAQKLGDAAVLEAFGAAPS